MPTGDEITAQQQAQLSQQQTQLSQQQTQLSQKDAQLSEQQSRIKQALLLSIELGLKLKFGNEGVAMLTEISAIADASLLEAIASSLLTVNSLDEVRQIYQNFSSNQ